MARRDWREELEFIRRWRGDDPWGRAAGRSRQEGPLETEPLLEGPAANPGAGPRSRAESGRSLGPRPRASRAPSRAGGAEARSDSSGVARRSSRFPLFEGLGRSEDLRGPVGLGGSAGGDPSAGRRIDLDAEDANPGSARRAPRGSRLILADPSADRSIRAAFPRAEIEFPHEAYCRIAHRLGSGVETDPELSRLPRSGLLFDLETTGFRGRPLFLIGMLHPEPAAGADPEGDGAASGVPWNVVQLLARDYAEEEAILAAFAQVAAEQETWVSFNGKAFDLPFLRDRARFHRLALPEPREHRDLLHAARRVYRGVLPNCRLQTLESSLFARYRYRDLPGGEIPAAYHDYVRTGDEEDMVRILRHNRDDLVTLARLLVHLGDA